MTVRPHAANGAAVARPAFPSSPAMSLAPLGRIGGGEPAWPGLPAARAFAIQVAVPGQPGGSAASVSAPPDAVGVGGSFTYPADGSVIQAGSVTSGAFATPGIAGRASATAEASASQHLRRRGDRRRDHRQGKGVGNCACVERRPVRFVDHRARRPGPTCRCGAGARVALGDWGYAVTLQQGTVSLDGARSKGARAFMTALNVRLTADHNGLPAGTEVMVGYAEASAQADIPTKPGAHARPRSATREAKKARAAKPAVRGPGIGPEEEPSLSAVRRRT